MNPANPPGGPTPAFQQDIPTLLVPLSMKPHGGPGAFVQRSSENERPNISQAPVVVLSLFTYKSSGRS